MGFFVVIIRTPVGLVASVLLLLWSLLVSLVYCLFFIFLAIFGKLTQINERLNPWLQTFNGVKCLPGLWSWVFRPYQGIFEDAKTQLRAEDAELETPESGRLLNRYRAAIAQQEQQPNGTPSVERGGTVDGSETRQSSSSSTTNP